MNIIPPLDFPPLHYIKAFREVTGESAAPIGISNALRNGLGPAINTAHAEGLARDAELQAYFRLPLEVRKERVTTHADWLDGLLGGNDACHAILADADELITLSPEQRDRELSQLTAERAAFMREVLEAVKIEMANRID